VGILFARTPLLLGQRSRLARDFVKTCGLTVSIALFTFFFVVCFAVVAIRARDGEEFPLLYLDHNFSESFYVRAHRHD
jgi:hypothetical protein